MKVSVRLFRDTDITGSLMDYKVDDISIDTPIPVFSEPPPESFAQRILNRSGYCVGWLVETYKEDDHTIAGVVELDENMLHLLNEGFIICSTLSSINERKKECSLLYAFDQPNTFKSDDSFKDAFTLFCEEHGMYIPKFLDGRDELRFLKMKGVM